MNISIIHIKLKQEYLYFIKKVLKAKLNISITSSNFYWLHKLHDCYMDH